MTHASLTPNLTWVKVGSLLLVAIGLSVLAGCGASGGVSGSGSGGMLYIRAAARVCLAKSASVSNYVGAGGPRLPIGSGGDLDVREAGHDLYPDLYLAFAKNSSAAKGIASSVATFGSGRAKNVAATTGNVAYWRLGALTSADRKLVAGCLQNATTASYEKPARKDWGRCRPHSAIEHSVCVSSGYRPMRFLEVRVSSVDRSYAIARVNYLHPISGILGGDDNLWLLRRKDGGWRARGFYGGRLSCKYVPAAVALDLLRNDPARRGESCVKESAFRVRASRICRRMNRTLRGRLPPTTAAFGKELDRIDALLKKLGMIQPDGERKARAWRDELRLLARVAASTRANKADVLKAASDMRKADNFGQSFGQATSEMFRVTGEIVPRRLANELANDATTLHLYGACELQSVVPPPLVG
jgi:hypothetical protein